MGIIVVIQLLEVSSYKNPQLEKLTASTFQLKDSS